MLGKIFGAAWAVVKFLFALVFELLALPFMPWVLGLIGAALFAATALNWTEACVTLPAPTEIVGPHGDVLAEKMMRRAQMCQETAGGLIGMAIMTDAVLLILSFIARISRR